MIEQKKNMENAMTSEVPVVSVVYDDGRQTIKPAFTGSKITTTNE
jgi:hypothetical protein